MQRRLSVSMRKCLNAVLVLIVLSTVNSVVAASMAFHNIFQNNKRFEHELGGINHIAQDPQGFMWFGGEKGLARYDGSNIRIYRHDPADAYSIAHDYIHGLRVDQQDVLWIATQAGLCYYQSRLDRFSCGQDPGERWPQEFILTLALDNDDNLYFSTRVGLHRLSQDRRQAIRLPVRGSEIANDVGVTSIVVDRRDIVWLGTEKSGLISLNPKTGQVDYYQANLKDKNSLIYDSISVLEIDQQDRLWIGTFGGGLSILNAERTNFENHRADEGGKGNTLSSNVIWDIFTDSLGTTWLAVDQGGLVRFDEREGFVATRHKPYEFTSLTSDQARVIYEDKNTDLWIGAFPSGISFFNRATALIKTFKHQPELPTSLSHSSILAIHRDDNDDIWVGTEDGLNLFDPLTGSFTRYQFGHGTDLSAKAVLSIAQYDPDTLWIGTWSGGLMAFDVNSRTFSAINATPAGEVGKDSRFIWSITRDQEGNMWIATQFNGVGRYDRTLKQFRFFTRDPKNPKSLPDVFVRAVMEDSQGFIWAGTTVGLAILPPGQDDFILAGAVSSQFSDFIADRVIALYEDRQGRVWVGTQDHGAFFFDPKTTQFHQIGIEQGLPRGMSSGFVEDSYGYVWILTTNGLVKVDVESLDLQVFGTEAGLASSNFNRNAALNGSNGFLYIGGAGGLSIFNPTDLGDEPLEFSVLITSMRLMNKEVRPGADNDNLSQSINFAESVQLGHRDRMVAFDFSALDYRHSQDTRYAYFLEGFDWDWNYIGTIKSATYTNIPPGTYRFRVKASHGKNDWTESRALRVVVHPAPWRTWWAYLGYLALLCIAAYFFAHYFRLRGHNKVYKTLSTTDPLTGVANRMGVTQAAKAIFSNRAPLSACVIFMDVDHFKRINDTRGHDSGDRILAEIAEVFRRCLRKSDVIGRWGGEEFLLICPGVDQAGGLSVAEKIRQSVAAHVFDQKQSPLKITLSLGVACVKPNESFEAAIKRADQALYRAKHAGRNCAMMAPQ